MNHIDILKYPSTRHLSGSSIQKNDSSDCLPFYKLKGKYLVIEEKIDGANSGLSFSDQGDLLMQSRGHYLLGHDKPHFDLFKMFCKTWENELFDILSNRYIMYGEWMFALHSIFYDLLPDYFFEFDIYDKFNKCFLSTAERRKITKSVKNVNIHSVPILFEGELNDPETMLDLIGESSFISNNALNTLIKEMEQKRYPMPIQDSLIKLNEKRLSEGLYIKVETEKETIGRYKFVRQDFTQTILDNELHWDKRPIINNIKISG